MRLTVATWNIHGGLSAPAARASFSDSLKILSAANPDIISLQEIELDRDKLELVGASADVFAASGLPHLCTFPMSPSHHTSDRLLAVGLAARWRITGIDRFLLPNPNLFIDHDEWGPVYTHDKGIIAGTLETEDGELTACALHSYPFHSFGASAHEERFSVVWHKMSEYIEGLPEAPLVFAGDFNTEDRQLVLRGMSQKCINAAAAQVVSRPNGECHDDILFSPPFRLIKSYSEHTFSDHNIVIAVLDTEV